MKSILIIGGDKRQTYLNEIFIKKGFICRHINSCDKAYIFGDIENFDFVVLPIPVTKDKKNIYSDKKDFIAGLYDILNKLTENQFLFGAGFDKTACAYLEEKKIPFYDLLDSEEFAIFNAYLTAQGAIRLLFSNTEEYIVSKKALVTGYGRVSKAVSTFLKNNGVDVSIAARNKVQLTEAGCTGCKIININEISNCVHRFDYIFNTVAFNIFTAEDIGVFKGKYFELASKPFGVNRAFFDGKTVSYIDGSSLPGKFLPLSSGEKIAEIILEQIP